MKQKLSFVVNIILILLGAFCIVGVFSLIKNHIGGAFFFAIISFICLFFPINKIIKNTIERRKMLPIMIIVGIITCILSISVLFEKPINHSYDNNKKDEERIEVIVIDFTTMDKELVESWCNLNQIKCTLLDDYSDTIKKGEAFKQSIKPQSKIYQRDKLTITFSLGIKPTTGQKNALKHAQEYLRAMAFSYTGLIKQLEYEGYSHDDAVYGVDNCNANWNEQATKMAKSYLDSMAFSRDGLIKQLEYEGFSYDEAVYGVEQNGY